MKENLNNKNSAREDCPLFEPENVDELRRILVKAFRREQAGEVSGKTKLDSVEIKPLDH